VGVDWFGMVLYVRFNANFALMQFFVGYHVLILKFTESLALVFQVDIFPNFKWLEFIFFTVFIIFDLLKQGTINVNTYLFF